MEEKKEEEKSEIEPKTEAVSEHSEPKKDPFSLIGKIAIVVIIGTALVGGGIYLGMMLNKGGSEKELPMVETNPTPQSENPTQEASTPSAQPTAAQEVKSITAGGTTGSTQGVYGIDVPAGWANTNEKNGVISKLTLTKNGHTVEIYQAAMGGGGCLYPGDPDSIMSQRYNNFVDIEGAEYPLRRSYNATGNPPESITYTVCQKSPNSTLYGLPTAYGSISVKTPNPSDPAVMKEVDFMLSSLVKK